MNHGTPHAYVVQLGRHGSQAGFNIAQAFPIGQLSKTMQKIDL